MPYLVVFFVCVQIINITEQKNAKLRFFLLQIIDMIHQRNAQVGGGCGVIKNSPPASSVFDRASSKQPQSPLCVGGFLDNH